MCSPTGCSFCAGMSIFGAIFMFILGVLIKNNYPFVGEYYRPEEGRGSPTVEQINTAARNCFIVMALYIGFTVMAFCFLFYYRSKAKRT